MRRQGRFDHAHELAGLFVEVAREIFVEHVGQAEAQRAEAQLEVSADFPAALFEQHVAGVGGQVAGAQLRVGLLDGVVGLGAAGGQAGAEEILRPPRYESGS